VTAMFGPSNSSVCHRPDDRLRRFLSAIRASTEPVDSSRIARLPRAQPSNRQRAHAGISGWLRAGQKVQACSHCERVHTSTALRGPLAIEACGRGPGVDDVVIPPVVGKLLDSQQYVMAFARGAGACKGPSDPHEIVVFAPCAESPYATVLALAVPRHGVAFSSPVRWSPRALTSPYPRSTALLARRQRRLPRVMTAMSRRLTRRPGLTSSRTRPSAPI
jgi:hypothetical protein